MPFLEHLGMCLNLYSLVVYKYGWTGQLWKVRVTPCISPRCASKRLNFDHQCKMQTSQLRKLQDLTTDQIS